ncbi:uncharacterized protein LOC144421017 isoform X2 [Styela clava]
MGFLFSKEMAQDRYTHQQEMKRLEKEYELRIKRSQKLTELEVRERLEREKQKMKNQHEIDMLEKKKQTIVDFVTACNKMGINPFGSQQFLDFARDMMSGKLAITNGTSNLRALKDQ